MCNKLVVVTTSRKFGNTETFCFMLGLVSATMKSRLLYTGYNYHTLIDPLTPGMDGLDYD